VGNSSSQEGWAPSAYLETAPAPTIKSPCSSGGTPSPSVSSQDSEHDHLQWNQNNPKWKWKPLAARCCRFSSNWPIAFVSSLF
jgi:hypothetical protein